jgi:hypothetical protein
MQQRRRQKISGLSHNSAPARATTPPFRWISTRLVSQLEHPHTNHKEAILRRDTNLSSKRREKLRKEIFLADFKQIAAKKFADHIAWQLVGECSALFDRAEQFILGTNKSASTLGNSHFVTAVTCASARSCAGTSPQAPDINISDSKAWCMAIRILKASSNAAVFFSAALRAICPLLVVSARSAVKHTLIDQSRTAGLIVLA